MRKFSRSIQRRRAALVGETRVVAHDEADQARADYFKSPAYQLSEIEQRKARIAEQLKALQEESKTLELAGSSIAAQSHSPDGQSVGWSSASLAP